MALEVAIRVGAKLNALLLEPLQHWSMKDLLYPYLLLVAHRECFVRLPWQ